MRERSAGGTVLVVLVSMLLAGCMQPASPGDDGGPAAVVDGPVDFVNEASDLGIDYQRAPSKHLADWWAEWNRTETMTFEDLIRVGFKPTGAPGVAIWDFDDDGDEDIFVPNGPGKPHRLYSNQLAETGTFGYEEVGADAGVQATPQDGTGVCYGDTDNDGDSDLVVLGLIGPHRFFENQGDGTFVDASDRAGLGEGRGAVACSMGDVDGDGLLDIAIANTWKNWSHAKAIKQVPFALNEPNHLFLNQGNDTFEDVSEASGIRDLPTIDEGEATITWALALVDYDRDGDLDLIQADDQAAMPQEGSEAVLRGYIPLFENDGTGNFTAVTREVNLDVVGNWMGFAFADYDANGQMDMFVTDLGDYFEPASQGYERGTYPSEWFLQRPDGSFDRPGVGALRATPFGWGTSPLDYDLDGDTDVVYHGGMIGGGIALQDNPGVLLANDGSARFAWDRSAFLGETKHTRRGVHGVAVGDLDDDGHPDIVTAAGYRIPPGVQFVPSENKWDSPFDEAAFLVIQFSQDQDGSLVWNGWNYQRGDLTVEINEGGTDRGWVKVRTVGSHGLLDDGRVNRDGIGAVVQVTPEDRSPAMRPVVGGSSYASQNSLTLTFGLGDASTATVDVLWPGGVRNRLTGVAPGETIAFPEIPCSVDGDWASEDAYRSCVDDALRGLQDAGVLTGEQADRYRASALAAFQA